MRIADPDVPSRSILLARQSLPREPQKQGVVASPRTTEPARADGADMIGIAKGGKPVAAGEALRTLDQTNRSRQVTDAQVRGERPSARSGNAGIGTCPAPITPVTQPIPAFLMGPARVIDGATRIIGGSILPAVGDITEEAGQAGGNLVRLVAGATGNGESVSDGVANVVERAGQEANQAFDAAGAAASGLANRGVVQTGIDLFTGIGAAGGIVGDRLIDPAATELADEFVVQAGRAQQAFNSNPAGFLDWLSGRDGPKVEDFTNRLSGVPAAIGDTLDEVMRIPILEEIAGTTLGFEYNCEGDFYSTNEHSLQSNFGYTDMYEHAGPALGMQLDTEIFYVNVNGVETRIQLWKGTYASGGAYGGEQGVYTRGEGERGLLGEALESNPEYYSAANGDSQIEMTQTISVDGRTPFTNTEDSYWNLAIRTDPNVSADQITQEGTLAMPDAASAQSLASQMKAAGLTNVEISADNVVSYRWE